MDFNDRDAPYPCLEIMENKQHSCTKVLTLKVHPPVIRAFPLVRKMLDTSHQLPEWSSIETKDIIDNFPTLCTGYIRFDTFHIAGYIALCTRYIRFDTFHIAGYIALCTGYIAFDTFHIAGYIMLCTGYIAFDTFHIAGYIAFWCVPPFGFGEVRYTSGYWEWVKNVLARYKETLDNIKTYDAIFASIFTHDHNENVLQAFYEN
ncbi:hypothetical protein H5410_040453 [Solanum commersonii]|uniref:Uncharacterized protein n=1 Tax=Solanum commersonii TaxID=4109 RepID=A0A9J5XNX0_SOLCO|nr:hypothetical protein H5410_040453 [Solanum commersonii]